MAEKLVADLEACKTCKAGTCCYEGVELTPVELKRIVQFNPPIAKPWFRLVEKEEQPDGVHHFSTLVRNGTCVFQAKDNRCAIYSVRPQYCRDFPLENNETAPHYKRLCVLFHQSWATESNVAQVY